MILNTVNKSLEVILGGAVTANQAVFHVSYMDINQTSFKTEAWDSVDGLTNDTTAVTMAGSPASGTSRSIEEVSIYNADTASMEIEVRINNNGTFRTLVKEDIPVGKTLEYTNKEGWKVVNIDAASGVGTEIENAIQVIASTATDTYDLGKEVSDGFVSVNGAWVRESDFSFVGSDIVFTFDLSVDDEILVYPTIKKIGGTQVVDNLTSTADNKALSANQGRLLDSIKANLSGGNTFSGDQVINEPSVSRANLVLSRFIGQTEMDSPQIILLETYTSDNRQISGRITGISSLHNSRDRIIIDVAGSFKTGGNSQVNISVKKTNDFTDVELVTCTYDSTDYVGVRFYGSASNWYPDRWFFTGQQYDSSSTRPIAVLESAVSNISSFTADQTQQDIHFVDETYFKGLIDVDGNIHTNGISFDGGANVLGDYQPLNWTPVVTSTGTTPLDTDITINEQWAFQIGDMIDAYCDVDIDTVNTVGNGSGVVIEGLPVARSTQFFGTVRIDSIATGTAIYLGANQYGGSNTGIIFLKIVDNGAAEFIDPGDIASGDRIATQVRYKV